jgi:hypothetical protein
MWSALQGRLWPRRAEPAAKAADQTKPKKRNPQPSLGLDLRGDADQHAEIFEHDDLGASRDN